MTWLSHKLLTGSIVFAATGNPVVAICTAAGSVLPDMMEGFPNQSDSRQWKKNHRRLSHWLPPYLLLCLFFWRLSAGSITTEWVPGELYYALFHNPYNLGVFLAAWFFAGACFHILQDAICGQVPMFLPRSWIGLRLFTVGSLQEYLLIIPWSLGLIAYRLL